MSMDFKRLKKPAQEPYKCYISVGRK